MGRRLVQTPGCGTPRLLSPRPRSGSICLPGGVLGLRCQPVCAAAGLRGCTYSGPTGGVWAGLSRGLLQVSRAEGWVKKTLSPRKDWGGPGKLGAWGLPPAPHTLLWMKVSPVPSRGPTPPLQVPAASRPHRQHRECGWRPHNNQGSQEGRLGGDPLSPRQLGGCLSLLTHTMQGVHLFIHPPPHSPAPFQASPCPTGSVLLILGAGQGEGQEEFVVPGGQS